MTSVFTREVTWGFDEGFYSGQGSTTEVPGRFPIAINGRSYLVIENSQEIYGEHFRTESLDIIRQQADNSGQPGEATITPEGLWRRSSDDWSHGAGQTHRDHPDSDPVRFRSSKGVNVWDRFQLSLLGSTARIATSANSNMRLMPAGARLYVTDGQTLKFTTDVTAATPTFTTVTSTPVQTAGGIASDGTNVWVVYAGGSGVYATSTGGTSASAYITDPVNGPIGYVKGRLMVANGAAVYNVTTTGALPTALFTQNNSAFTWVGFAEGAGQIYAAGFAGDKSLIYRTEVKTDGTALDAMIVAGELPTGEIVRSIQGYLGYVVIGSDKGVRFAQPNQNGDLVIGSLIQTGMPVLAMVGDDRFVYFGWTNYDGVSTGLGRMDLSVFTDTTRPAYASDLMATAQGAVGSVATFQGIRCFAVAASGLWTEKAVKVASGTLDSGTITYSLPDPKVAMFVDLSMLPLVGSISAQLSSDNGSFGTVGQVSAAGSVDTSLVANQQRARAFETRMTLNRASVSDTAGPILTRWTLRSYPAPTMAQQHIVPIMLHDKVLDNNSAPYEYDVTQERARFDDLLNTRALVTYQEGQTVHTVFVDALKFLQHHRTEDGTDWCGTLVVQMKEFLS